MSTWLHKNTRVALYLRDGRCCAYCGTTWTEDVLTIDHVIPRSKGGKNTWSNMLTVCWHCNTWRRDQGLEYVAREQGITMRELRARIRKHVRRSEKKYRALGRATAEKNPRWLRWVFRVGERRGLEWRFPDRHQTSMFPQNVGGVPYTELICPWCTKLCEHCLEGYLNGQEDAR